MLRIPNTTGVRLLLAAGLALVAGLGPAGCAAPGGGASTSAAPATPGRVTFIDYNDFVRLNLVNVAHTDPVEYYSEVRTTASTKVTDDDVFLAMLDYFEEQGFESFAEPGFAPVAARDGGLQALEVETAEGTRYLVYGQMSSQEARKAFVECVLAWQQIFNLTRQSQAVTNRDGEAVFDNQETNTIKLNR